MDAGRRGDDGDISGEEEAETGAGVLRGLQEEREPDPVCPPVLQPALLHPRGMCGAGDLSVSAGLRGLRLFQM